jgi:integrase
MEREYRGLKIIEYVDRRSGLTKFKTRFQLKGEEYNPSRNSYDALKKEINRIFSAVDEGKNPKIETEFPFVDDVLKRQLEKIADRKKKTHYQKVYEDFLSVIPPLRVNELTATDFNAYITLRRAEINGRTDKPIRNATINKGLSAINVALSNAPKYFRALHGFKPEKVEKLPNDYERRTRTVQGDEFEKLFAYLYQPRMAGEREKDFLFRVRLGHWIEFKSMTGLRRAEIALLKPENYDKSKKALIDFLRPKTGKTVKFFPLTLRAAEIIEERLKAKGEYIFTENGKPIESHYRKLKNICSDLNIKYGSFTKGGFVLHDLRRNFATEIVRNTDIETAREFLGHADLTHTGIYLTTDKSRMTEAVRKMDGIELETEISEVVKGVKSGKVSVKKAVEKLLNIVKGR